MGKSILVSGFNVKSFNDNLRKGKKENIYGS